MDTVRLSFRIPALLQKKSSYLFQQAYQSMKINILTIQGRFIYGNYGSALQAYALQQFLKQAGHDPLLILGMNYFHSKFLAWAQPIYSSLRVVCPFLRHLIDVFRLRFSPVAGPSERRKRFAAFVKKFIHTTPCGYTFQELIHHLPTADACICGSDQIWFGANALCYFFPKQNRNKCISYAASGAWPILEKDDAWQHSISPYLRELRAVGVRETDGVTLSKRLGAKNVMQTIDPTLLLPAEHYEQIMQETRIIKEPYMLFYILNSKSLADVPIETAKRYCAEHGLRLAILSGQGTEGILPSELNMSTGPLEFLNLIKHASAVITNSFHGSIFCILFQIPYLVCLQNGETAAENVRFYSAHTRLGQACRLGTMETLDLKLLNIAPTDAIPFLQTWKQDSQKFLQTHLENIANE